MEQTKTALPATNKPIAQERGKRIAALRRARGALKHHGKKLTQALTTLRKERNRSLPRLRK